MDNRDRRRHWLKSWSSQLMTVKMMDPLEVKWILACWRTWEDLTHYSSGMSLLSVREEKECRINRWLCFPVSLSWEKVFKWDLLSTISVFEGGSSFVSWFSRPDLSQMWCIHDLGQSTHTQTGRIIPWFDDFKRENTSQKKKKKRFPWTWDLPCLKSLFPLTLRFLMTRELNIIS